MAPFDAATYVFDNPLRLEQDDVFAEGEYRNIVIGRVDGVVLNVGYSCSEEELCRIISARPATAHERKPMGKVSFTRKRGAKFRFSDKERARLDSLSEKEVESGARADSDNPPRDNDQLNRMALAREVRRVREKTGLSQRQFAARFHIGLARLRDFEQGRSEPDFIVRVFLRMILEDPSKADRLVKMAERDGAASA